MMNAARTDGAGYQLRKKTDVERHIDEGRFRRHLGAVDVDDVAYGMKDIKTDADRQYYLQYRQVFGKPKVG